MTINIVSEKINEECANNAQVEEILQIKKEEEHHMNKIDQLIEKETKMISSIKIFFQRSVLMIKTFFKKKSTKYGILIGVGIIVLILSTVGITLHLLGPKNSQFGVSIQQRIGTLKQSHNYYKKVATKEELMVTWIEMFSRSTYKKDGNSKYNEYDCISAVIHFLWKYGANVVMEDIEGISQRSEKLAALGQLDIRKSARDVKPGDIIIMNPYNGSRHCAIVMDVVNDYVVYFDSNSETGTYGMGKHKWGSDRIQRIFEVSYSFWVGNIMRDFNN